MTSYGAQGGNAGGGFMPGSQGEGSASNKRTYRQDTLRPVTIKQLIDAHHPHPDAEYVMIDGAEALQVTFVGQIRNISSQTTNVTYKIDDGTGIIEVKVWVDAEAQMGDVEMDGIPKRAKPQEQEYARVFGRVKNFNNKRHVGAIAVRPVTDYNEISYHLLEATVVHLHFSKGSLDSLQADGGAQGANGTDPQANGNGTAHDMSGMSGLARKVFTCLRQTPQTNEGLHAQDIAARTSLEVTEVLKAGDELMSLGKVYTTVDDMTWALLDL